MNLLIISGVIFAFLMLKRKRVNGGVLTASFGGGTTTTTAALVNGENGDNGDNGDNGGESPTRTTRGIPTRLEFVIRRWSAIAERIEVETEVPATLILALIRHASAGDPTKIGSNGGIGLMQMTPAAWKESTGQLVVPTDPFSNVLGGTNYLVLCLIQMGYSKENPHWFQALRAYIVGAERAGSDSFAGRDFANKVIEYQRLI